eukprot:TRINITY_DN37924_c0_g1_i1.p1 TRINITY_DN37924_c0_g1~~TRINITY_DN37924_c0_g1_i1.p1  ORF type:complete len:567 (+),score=87.27 TRINITY_DN37924_c0_g1_i1:272-1972(+)
MSYSSPRNFTTLLLVLLASIVHSSPCAPQCRFMLCSYEPLSISSPPDRPITSAICLNASAVGVANSGEARVFSKSSTTRPKLISSLSPPLAPSFFKTYSLTNGSAAVGHQVLPPAASATLQHMCVALPIHNVQFLAPDGSVLRNEVFSRPLVDCVSFEIGSALSPSSSPVSISASSSLTVLSTPAQSPSASPAVVTPDPTPSLLASAAPTITPSSSPAAQSPSVVSVTTSTSATPSPIPPVPDVVGLNETVLIPPSTQLSDPITFNITAEVRAGSGSTLEDLYLLTDLTTSTTSVNAEIRDNFAQIVDARSAVSSNVAFGVGAYTDEGDDPFFENRQPVSTNISAVQQAINGLQIRSTSNIDIPEANLAALYTVATSDEIGWRNGSRRIVVLFGDAPGHEPSCLSSLELRRGNVIAALNNQGITVVASSFFPGLNEETTSFGCDADADPAPTDVGQGDAITSGTGGSIVELEEQAQLIENVLASVDSLSQTLEADTSECDAQNVNVSFSPGLPLTISSGSSESITQTVQMSACGDAKGAFACTVRFSLSGAPVGEQNLTSSGLDAC